MAASPWTVAVIGTGALGGFYGSRLLQSGHEVHFIARGKTLDALRNRGIRLIQDDRDFTEPSVSATDQPATLGTVDFVLFATKGQHLEQAVPAAQSLVGDTTVVLPILNGMDISERIAKGLRRGIVLGGLTRVVARLLEPGVVVQTGEVRPLVMGPLDPGHERIARETAQRLMDAGINVDYSESIQTDIWLKFIGWCAAGGTQCTCGMPASDFIGHPEFSEMFKNIVREGEALATATGVSLPSGLVDRMVVAMKSYPPGTNVSVYDDMRAGRPLELETTLGAVVALGARLGIPTPASQRAYDAMKPFEGGTG